MPLRQTRDLIRHIQVLYLSKHIVSILSILFTIYSIYWTPMRFTGTYLVLAEEALGL
jgi:hypothetical protein